MKKTKKKKKVIEKKIFVESFNPLEESTIEKIKKHFGGEYEITYLINPSLLGGIKIRKDNVLFDGSIVNQLENLRIKLYNSKSHDRN